METASVAVMPVPPLGWLNLHQSSSDVSAHTETRLTIARATCPAPVPDVKPVLLSGCHVVELGSGTGCVGLTAALLGASKVTITDLPQFLPLMRKNIHQNQDILECVVDARELTWGNLEQGAALTAPDVLVLADCIYYEESLEPLVTTVRSLCRSNTTVIISYEERTTGNKPQLQSRFFELMEENFRKEKIPLKEQHELYRSDDIHLFKFHLRYENGNENSW
ncbi:protein N-lysine methyltransferase METTL21D isoform X3 [Procambarus clarkii]|uniref:protein N-lysine methyltransferase METTL21D isoform X3 n=1 Tax=Procambarus clarkii TaxID=6728 RepID=UPI001E67143F|nr:protein N-lysine methyltransferase METTL21D-like isoform X3 [Procambarus clarkii]